MCADFQVANVCGTVYKGGNLVFLPDGNTLCSPVGNRIAVYDLVNNKSRTLTEQTSADIAVMDVHPNGKLLLAVDIDGYAVLMNLQRNVLLHRMTFKDGVSALKFSHDGEYFAVGHGRRVEVWKTPGLECQFNGFTLHRVYGKQSGKITALDWSHDSRYLVAGCAGCTTRVYTLHTVPGYHACWLGGHKSKIQLCSFLPQSYDIMTVAHDGAVQIWRRSEQEPRIAPSRVKRPVSTRRPKTRGWRAVKGEEATAAKKEEEVDDGEGGMDEGEEGQEMQIKKEEEASSDESGEEDAEKEESEDGDEEKGEEGDDEEEDDDGNSADTSSSDGDDDNNEEQADAGTKRRRPAVRLDISATVPVWRADTARRHYLKQANARVSCAVLHKATSVLTVGFNNGVFALYDVPEFNTIHSLSVSQKRISSAAVNASGEWLALGCSRLGQLLVWEWQSESYVLKQQGHFYDTDVVAFSPEGHIIATGGGDGKVKLWNASSGFCIVTFDQHQGGVSGLSFTPNGMAVVSSSLDGTVRAFDLMRYRNFRTFTKGDPTQLSCVAVDSSGELVCAASQDTFEAYVWSMQTGGLVQRIAGHTAPVSAVAFRPGTTETTQLVSTSWDGTMRLWDVFETSQREAFEHSSDVVCMAVRADGKQLATSTLKGTLTLWDLENMREAGVIDCRRDVANGRRETDLVSAKQMNKALHWTSLEYAPTGAVIIAGGNSKFVCVYSVKHQVLLARLSVSENHSLDGIKAKLNSKNNTEFGPIGLIDTDSDSDVEERVGRSLPGVSKGDRSTRRARPTLRVKSLSFCSDGRAFAAATTEGLMVFAKEEGVQFDPYDLDIDVTPEATRAVLAEKDFPKALVLAFRLNEADLVQEVLETIPPSAVQVVVELLPIAHIQPLLQAIARLLPITRHIAFYMMWAKHVFTVHGQWLRGHSTSLQAVLRDLQKAITTHHTTLGRLCEENTHMLSFASHMLTAAQQEADAGAMELEVGPAGDDDGEVDAKARRNGRGRGGADGGQGNDANVDKELEIASKEGTKDKRKGKQKNKNKNKGKGKGKSKGKSR